MKGVSESSFTLLPLRYSSFVLVLCQSYFLDHCLTLDGLLMPKYFIIIFL